MSFCSLHPSLRFILPMIGGIVCGDYFYYTEWAGVILPIFIALFLWLLCTYRLNRGHSFGVAAGLFFFFFGMVLMGKQLDRVIISYPAASSCYQIQLVDHPVEKRKSFLYRAVLDGWWTPDGQWHPVKQPAVILCYLAKDTLTPPPLRGDCLWIYTQVKQVAPVHLPDAFDYSRYLRHHGVSGTAYVSARHWKRVRREESRTFKQMALDARANVVHLYQQLGFTGDELAVLSALTVGYKEALGEEIRETYSVAGASHVLALSGLHVGFIYGLLFFICSFLWKRWPLLKWPLSVGMMGLLWLFAFFTGLSVSVVRAVVMCSLFILMSFRREPVNSFDALLTAVFIMLVYQPCWLFDVSFQLSFSAVAAILLFYPALYASLPVKSFYGRKIWALMAVSLAAQLGTAPLILHYFSHFSTHFLCTNLLVIPLVSLILYASIIMLLLTPVPAVQHFFSVLVDGLLQVQHQGLRWIEHLPYASLDFFQLDGWEVGWLYFCLFLAYRYLLKPTASRLLFFLGVILLGATGHLASSVHHAPQDGIAFYASQGKKAIHCFSKGARSWVVCPDSLSDSLVWSRWLKPYWNRLRLKEPLWVGKYYHDGTLSVQEPFLFYRSKCICLLSDNRLRYRQAVHPFLVDYLYVAPGYAGGVKELSAVFRLHTVILDAGVSPGVRKRIKDECRELGWVCTEQKESGMLFYHW